ncbi:MAG: hypothetical protein V4689_12240 [Verrucomicrobiota bacterium]
MKSFSFSICCCGVLTVAALIASAAEPEDGDQQNFREVAIGNALNQRNPQVHASGGYFAVSSNDDGTFSMDAMGTMDLLASKSLVDISPLAGVPLVTANFWKMPIKDLSPLKGSKLRELMLAFAEASDLLPLTGMPLTDLSLWGCNNLSDITPLKSMPIKNLNLEGVIAIRDLTPLDGMKLETLRLEANGIKRGIEVIRKMPSLKEINRMPAGEFWKKYDTDQPWRDQLRNAGIEFTSLNVSEAGKLSLGLSGKDPIQLEKLKDLPVVSLGISDSKVVDLTPLAGLQILDLALESSELTDLSPLRRMAFKSLWLECGRLKDLSPLIDTKLEYLTLKCPKVVDLSPIKKLPLKGLNIRHCGVTDLAPLREMSIEDLDFDMEQFPNARDILRKMPNLKRINFQDAADYFSEGK